MPLFVVVLVIYKYKKVKIDVAVHLAVAGAVFDGVFLCCPFTHEMS